MPQCIAEVHESKRSPILTAAEYERLEHTCWSMHHTPLCNHQLLKTFWDTSKTAIYERVTLSIFEKMNQVWMSSPNDFLPLVL
jgi:hypothetical protein